MLNFKVGKTYKDFLGKEWEFCSYCSIENYPYRFKDKYGDIKSFKEYTDTIVTEWDDGTGIRIPFVEEKEEKKEGKEEYWRIYKKYDCIDTHNQKIISLELIEKRRNGPIIQYRFSGQELGTCYFTDLGEIAVHHGFVVYKNGIPQGVKDTINRLGKLVNKQRYFQKGMIYIDQKKEYFTFIKRFKASNGLFGVFEKNKNKNLLTMSLKKINNIECVVCCNRMIFCADESIRNEDTEKAVIIKE